MKLRGLVVTAAVACTVGWFGRSVYSDDPPAAPPASPPADASADSNAEWVEFARPGEEHARLKQLVGDWAVHGKFTGFDGKLEEGDSVASFTMILGDRYLRQEAVGSFLGTPFEGRGIIGYDKAVKKWVSVWLDTMGTGMMVAEGRNLPTTLRQK